MPEEPRREEDIAAIFEALRSAIRARPAGAASTETSAPVQLDARRELDRYWRVSAERRFHRRPGLVGLVYGALVLPFKWVLRRLMRWYVEPMAADQRAFNAAVMRALDEQAEWMQAELKRRDSQPPGR